jgi:hypothetical protein
MGFLSTIWEVFIRLYRYIELIQRPRQRDGANDNSTSVGVVHGNNQNE